MAKFPGEEAKRAINDCNKAINEAYKDLFVEMLKSMLSSN